ncbi:DUF6318 family protein, partial [Jatrophihabitans endophyticus]|uniref:DUF6318 family protein n=1 Tax=Jatrophihabitans endophyticus TaxID=1206085 RepID=UPI0019F1BA23
SVPTTGPNVRPGESPPKLPALGRKHSAEGAEVFADFWLRTWDWAFATTNASLMMSYYAKSCSDCAKAASQFPRLQKEDEHILGGRFSFKKSVLVYNDKRFGSDIAVDLTFAQARLRLVTARGKTVQRDPRVAAITFRLWLKWVRGAWTVVQKGHVS